MSDREIANLRARIEVLEQILADLLAENAHSLVGGQGFAEDSIRRIKAAELTALP